MKLDILAFGAHPDDVELAASGTLVKQIKQGKTAGIVDLTRGEMGTRGTAEDRDMEAVLSSNILGLSARENLRMEDAFFEINKDNKRKVIAAIRAYRPEVILAPALNDRHPDHTRAGQLLKECFFMAGLVKIETSRDGIKQDPWRPKRLFHYIQYRYAHPDFVVDITNEMDTKMEAIRAFKSQFYNPASSEPSTLISSEGFFDYIKARAIEMGSVIGTKYGEGFQSEQGIKVDDLIKLV